MLPKKERLTSKMFDRFFSSGRRINSDLWQIVYVPSSDFRAAVVVGKKIDKSAVKRNRLRRQVYNLLYRYHKYHQRNGAYLILTRPPIKTTTFAEIKDKLHSTLRQIEKKHLTS